MAMYRFNHIGFGSSGIARASAFFVLLLLLIGCTGGDDDGRRIGDTIVGTWHRGTNPDDVVIEGDAELDPDALPIQKLIFLGDGSYNGMVRKGSFQALSKDGEITSEGTYQCDNSNLRLEYIDEYSEKQKLLMQVVSFTEEVVRLRYVMGTFGVTITVNIYKQQ
jgi:hypothetical protein